MQFNRKEFVNMLSKVQGITSKKTSLAIANNILFKKGEILATDFDMIAKLSLNNNYNDEDIFCCNSKKLFEILRSMTDNQVDIEINNKMLIIKNESTKFNLVISNHDDFPEIEQDTYETFEISSDLLKQIISVMSLIPAPSDEKRAHIIGVNFGTNDGKLEICSTDNKRLNILTTDIPFKNTFIIHKNSLPEIAKFISGDTMTIGVGDRFISFIDEDNSIIIKRISGIFPDYTVIFKKEYKKTLLNKEVLSGMLKRALVFYSDNHNNIMILLKDNKIEVTSSNADYGDYREEREIKYDGNDFFTSLNPKYVLDAIGIMEGVEIDFSFIDEVSPAIFRKNNVTCVIMPIRINE